MLAFTSLKRRLLGAVGVASTTAFVLISLSTPATAQPVTTPTAWPVLQLANPGPGSVISNGDYIVSGMAYDPTATEGSGVSRVDLFLGNRDEGGTFLGSAVPGQDLIQGVSPDTRLATTGFQIKVTVPTSASGGQDFYAYAFSSSTGAQTAVEMPVFIGAEPTATPSTSTSAQPKIDIVQLQPAVAATGAETFSLANPHDGDVVLNGDYVVSGGVGAAIDRVELFLDSRDSGGAHLGTVVPTGGSFALTVTLPTNVSGGHNFVAYARSSLTGQETQVSIPIYVGAAPTPTAHPS